MSNYVRALDLVVIALAAAREGKLQLSATYMAEAASDPSAGKAIAVVCAANKKTKKKAKKKVKSSAWPFATTAGMVTAGDDEDDLMEISTSEDGDLEGAEDDMNVATLASMISRASAEGDEPGDEPGDDEEGDEDDESEEESEEDDAVAAKSATAAFARHRRSAARAAALEATEAEDADEPGEELREAPAVISTSRYARALANIAASRKSARK